MARNENRARLRVFYSCSTMLRPLASADFKCEVHCGQFLRFVLKEEKCGEFVPRPRKSAVSVHPKILAGLLCLKRKINVLPRFWNSQDLSPGTVQTPRWSGCVLQQKMLTAYGLGFGAVSA